MKPEFQDLMERYLDGTASAEEVREVDEWLRRDPAAREALFQTAAVEVDLRRLLSSPMPRHLAEDGRKPAASRRFFAYAAMVAAVAGWVLALFLAGQYRAKCGEQQATLERLAALEAAKPPSVAREAVGRPIAVGRLIETRGLVLSIQKGQAQPIPMLAESPIPLGGSLWTCPWGGAAIQFSDGTSMDLERSTEVAISQSESVRHAVIKKGILMVDNTDGTPEAAMVIVTSHASVKVVKAQVAVAEEGGRTIVEVAQGHVQVTRTSDGRVLTVGANHYTIVSPAAEPKALDGRLAWRLEPAGP